MSQYEIDYLHDKEQIESALVISINGTIIRFYLNRELKKRKDSQI
jgi:hypothetical protein